MTRGPFALDRMVAWMNWVPCIGFPWGPLAFVIHTPAKSVPEYNKLAVAIAVVAIVNDLIAVHFVNLILAVSLAIHF